MPVGAELPGLEWLSLLDSEWADAWLSLRCAFLGRQKLMCFDDGGLIIRWLVL
ncbi:MAG: hypothetical protein XD66_1229 [Thermacetogenium phaeum]|uniref:Uncharacterized protein n=1 Tax=Thermacetogenium phaeum TaxID=85874 RepID=A0A101FFH5_9THEO|nr:MAG: hypothetical protein XD66_1229 [Thermacetogenium phaeum]